MFTYSRLLTISIIQVRIAEAPPQGRCQTEDQDWIALKVRQTG